MCDLNLAHDPNENVPAKQRKKLVLNKKMQFFIYQGNQKTNLDLVQCGHDVQCY